MPDISSTNIVMLNVSNAATIWLGLIELEHVKSEMLTAYIATGAHNNRLRERILALGDRIEAAKKCLDNFSLDDIIKETSLFYA